ncbi:cytochrome C oxidase subunit IV family protein [Pseudomonas chlororaphis]|uniref:cytochrome C oxidase subunit IV family protein n=1 Tax=Pseudomonas chlororaphis TaxID=587753 RepID=UPI001B33DA22|nr:cytochrome C oxidase subunit IV family protein [Pseudomonas chlororaphis]MBP5076483.1 cytochrome C oxidase subunit IV family protein [Pseudomonas chlororaphis]
MSAGRFLLSCWAALASLSLGTVWLGSWLGQGAPRGVALLILLLAVAKAWLIADGFMELRHGPRLWRWLLLGWPLALALLLGLILSL